MCVCVYVCVTADRERDQVVKVIHLSKSHLGFYNAAGLGISIQVRAYHQL